MSEPSTVTVYCASSRQADPEYRATAHRLGTLLAEAGVTVVYGGGAVGSMGALADGALERGGRVEGVLPRFMHDLEWGHPRLSDLHVVSDLHERKRLMIDRSDAIVALPGGCGTFEELFEAITWKRLGLYANPIVLMNVRGYWDPAIALLEGAVRERFMDDRHRDMWSVVDAPEQVLDAIREAPAWGADAREFAVP
ncbi:MAG: TIGR00730 family Rossman fold protein [Myxococcales bacterium]|nr:TIGR00730 family Rossman fold protein [Myxococcales bacterium]